MSEVKSHSHSAAACGRRALLHSNQISELVNCIESSPAKNNNNKINK